MGSSSSKPSSPQVWKGTSTGVSQHLLESLQSGPETDVSRQQSLELEIQARVAAELKRLREQESQALREAQEKVSAEATDDAKQTQYTVSKEVQALRTKLEERKQLRELPASLESARSEVVRCLRENDRRPLDCWREVEAFKEEVRRLEKGWVDKVVG
ncbi:hypothetical protein QBC35DRAFT_546788 [Podospora australis]|uniref:MICOS complex subunit mic19 n=1 Tax=Podospora australis TaxID=1536484 RepID=A0AAN6WW04_9PEZI|nr:hypothetical protein QBC35DRAFT_546788 [Podospora australis]